MLALDGMNVEGTGVVSKTTSVSGFATVKLGTKQKEPCSMIT